MYLIKKLFDYYFFSPLASPFFLLAAFWAPGGFAGESAHTCCVVQTRTRDWLQKQINLYSDGSAVNLDKTQTCIYSSIIVCNKSGIKPSARVCLGLFLTAAQRRFSAKLIKNAIWLWALVFRTPKQAACSSGANGFSGEGLENIQPSTCCVMGLKWLNGRHTGVNGKYLKSSQL